MKVSSSEGRGHFGKWANVWKECHCFFRPWHTKQKSQNKVIPSTSFGQSVFLGTFVSYLSEHFWKVVDVGGAQRLRLESLGLQQVLGHIGGVDEHAMQRTLLVSICLEHDLYRESHFKDMLTSP